MRRLAEYRLLALSHDNAEAVHRAVADGHREAARSLRTSATEMSRQIELAARNATAVVLAVLGLAGLLARIGQATLVLVGPVTVVSVFALLLGSLAGLARLADARQELDATRGRIEDDPLLPEEDRNQILRHLEALDFDARATSTRRRVWSLTALAVLATVCAPLAILFVLPGGTEAADEGDPPPATPAPTPGAFPSFSSIPPPGPLTPRTGR